MRTRLLILPLLLATAASSTRAQGTAPTFRVTLSAAAAGAAGGHAYVLAGTDPAQAKAVTIPTLLVPVALVFATRQTAAGAPFVLDAARVQDRLLRSPVFSDFSFPPGTRTQYMDAMLRATFPLAARGWHTRLGRPEVEPVSINVPAGAGYVLTSKRQGGAVAVVDRDFVERAIFRQVPREPGKLVIAVTLNTTYYALGDATVCCSWGTHGVDPATGDSFVLGSYLQNAPPVVHDRDVQPLTQQLAEYILNPGHNPLLAERARDGGNIFPAWMRPMGPGGCGGTGAGSTYFMLEPTDSNPKNNFPASAAFVARTATGTYHLANVALLPWYLRDAGSTVAPGVIYSFPNAHALTRAAQPCPKRLRAALPTPPPLAAAAAPAKGAPNGHWLIGYWAGYGSARNTLPLRDVSPQWDVVIVAFATPGHGAPEGTMQFHPPAGMSAAAFQADVRYLQKRGTKVEISLGGGGQHFTLAHAAAMPNFINSVEGIVSEYGFNGVDLDFESPSLALAPGDNDFRHPVTPSVVNLIAAMRQLHRHFGPGFMISLVPEGTQIPGGYPSYGGQFGSYLALTYGIRHILSFIDVQDYNTPPLEGLDGEIYQPGTVDYHAAMTELLLHGFNVGRNPRHFFPPLPAGKVAIGFLNGDTTPAIVDRAMAYLISGTAPAGSHYRLRRPGGYPGLIGAMFWTINADARDNYNYSNLIGPELHRFPEHAPSRAAAQQNGRPVAQAPAR